MATERRQVSVSFVDPDSVVIESHMGSRGRAALMALLPGGAVLVVYARALWGDFIYLDDRSVVLNAPLRSVWPGLYNIWLHPTVLPHYQPLAYSLLVAEFKVFGTGFSGGYLAINVLLHLCNVLLLWVMLRRLEVTGAVVAALLFAVHPMNVQAVGWISQQPLLLCGVFSFLSLLVWLRLTGIDPAPQDTGKLFRLPESRWMLLGLVLVLSGCAMASHSIAVALPVVMAVLIWWERARLSPAEVGLVTGLLVMSQIWAAVTWIADARQAAGVAGALDAPIALRALERLGATWGYLWNLIAPVQLSLIHSNGSQEALVGWLVLGGLVVILVGAWRVRPRLGRGPFAAAAMVLGLLLPTLVFRTDLDEWSSRADQLFYLPGAVLIVAITGTIAQALVARPSWQGQTVTVGVAGLLAVLSVIRLGDFRDSRRLWESVLDRDPESLIALNSLGRMELSQGEFAQSRERFTRALRAHPNELSPLLNLAHSYELEGDYDKMIMRYQEALAKAPEDIEVHLGLGNAYAAKDNSTRAIEEYQYVLGKSPGHVAATYRLGLAYRMMGDLDRAVEMFEAALRLNPADAAPHIDLANIAFARGDLEGAVQWLEEAARIDPSNFRIYLNVGAQLGTLAEDPRISPDQRLEWQDRAEDFLRTAVHLNPESPEARYNLGGLLFNRRKLDEAVFHLSKAVELSPRNADFRQALNLATAARGARGVR